MSIYVSLSDKYSAWYLLSIHLTLEHVDSSVALFCSGLRHRVLLTLQRIAEKQCIHGLLFFLLDSPATFRAKIYHANEVVASLTKSYYTDALCLAYPDSIPTCACLWPNFDPSRPTSQVVNWWILWRILTYPWLVFWHLFFSSHVHTAACPEAWLRGTGRNDILLNIQTMKWAKNRAKPSKEINSKRLGSLGGSSGSSLCYEGQGGTVKRSTCSAKYCTEHVT